MKEFQMEQTKTTKTVVFMVIQYLQLDMKLSNENCLLCWLSFIFSTHDNFVNSTSKYCFHLSKHTKDSIFKIHEFLARLVDDPS